MNKMEDVAKVIGVELNKKFRIEGEKEKYLLKEDGLYKWTDDRKLVPVDTDFLLDIFMGRKKVVTPWIPKEDEVAYIPIIPAKGRKNLKDLCEDGLLCKTDKEASRLYDRLIQYARRMKGLE